MPNESTPNETKAIVVPGQEVALALASGRGVSVDPRSETITFRSPSGACILEVRLTDAGPVLRFESGSVEIVAPERLAISSERVEICAGSLSVTVAGDMVEQIGGSARRTALGAASLTGADLELEATSGGVQIAANDDVDVSGERVRLNCDDPPMPVSWEEHQQRMNATRTERLGS